jgi:outer membrane lipoprotein-sorting protein/RNA polymerase subunit RPABC4/transcription elongation factor Spt4
MPAKICQSCGSKLAEDARFCPTCGKEVAVKVCPACGAKLTEGVKFCPGCGVAVTSTPSQSAVKEQPSEPRPDTAVNEKEKSNLRRLSIICTSMGIGLAVIAVIMFVYFVKAGVPESMMGSSGQGTVPTSTTSKTTTTSTTTSTEKTLNDLLSLSANMVSIKYDMSVSGQGIPTTTATVWAKKNRMRMEITQQGMNVITLIDDNAKTMYTYMPAQNLAMKIPFDSAQAPKSPTEDAESILNSNAKIVGTETVDGKVCSVVEYASGQDSVKAWIWQDKGLPIRIETTSSTGKTVIEYKNIDFSDIPDSVFELPAGVTIM